MLTLVADEQGVGLLLTTVEGGPKIVYFSSDAEDRPHVIVEHRPEEVEALLLRRDKASRTHRFLNDLVLFKPVPQKALDLILEAKRHLDRLRLGESHDPNRGDPAAD